jgi:hypothetical protein
MTWPVPGMAERPTWTKNGAAGPVPLARVRRTVDFVSPTLFRIHPRPRGTSWPCRPDRKEYVLNDQVPGTPRGPHDKGLSGGALVAIAVVALVLLAFGTCEGMLSGGG